MTRRPVAHGYLLFGAFGRDGQWFEGLRGRLKARFRGLNPPVFQVQALVCGLNPLTPGDKQQVQQLFLQARQALVKQVLAQLEGKR
jgi:hypothetical protein